MNKRELNDLMISWVTISLAFAMVSKGLFNMMSFVAVLLVMFLAVGTAFIFHELAHRQVAKRFGCHAEYRAWKIGLVIALVLGFLALVDLSGFVFAAPGAVYIYGTHITRRENGIISLSGPLTNAVLGIAFWVAAEIFAPWGIGWVLGSVASINIFLGLFNLIPVFPLDGAKVFAWSPVVWAVVFFPLALLLFFPRALWLFI